MKYRDRTEITARILDVAQEGTIITKIMYAAFITHLQLKEYLAFLKENSLLEYNADTKLYHTTEKGIRFLDSYKEMERLLYPRESKVSTTVSQSIA
jgi:predicted transcriptional regulator